MKLFCEIIVELLPSLRALIAEELMNGYRLNQKEIAKRLFVTQPAISQYLRNLRGGERKLLDGSVQEIRNLCSRLYNNEVGKEELLKELYNICSTAASLSTDVMRLHSHGIIVTE
jgi:predicted transcriptional regulator